MYIDVGRSGIDISAGDIILGLIIFACIAVAIAIISRVIFRSIRNSDNQKPMIQCGAKILDVISSASPKSSIAWYMVETENGERLKLRSFNANSLILSKGDTGIISYRGQTIVDFVRK